MYNGRSKQKIDVKSLVELRKSQVFAFIKDSLY